MGLRSIDFLQYLNPDLSSIIFSYLDDPVAIIRVSAVSRSWRQFVIVNGLSKKLCLKLHPEVSWATRAIEGNNAIEPVEGGPVNDVEAGNLNINHQVYALLARGLSPTLRKDCISLAICASSTDHYPEERMRNTLNPYDRFGDIGCYWSSEGESDPVVPETLTYKLSSNLCFVTEINIRPFQVFWEVGFPICSAKTVRFRMGHVKSLELGRDLLSRLEMDRRSVDDFMVWTYVSPEFPMAQENHLQKFKLPEPVLCLGGILQIELLGRVQSCAVDGLYYICISHVQVVGRPLSPAFDVKLNEITGKWTLKYI